MDRVDFYSVMKVIRDYISPDRGISQKKLMETIFNEFSQDDDFKNFDFDQGQVWRWLNGQVKVSPKITGFYLKKNSRVNDLAGDILVGIFPIVSDVGNMLVDLRELILNDITISGDKKNQLLREDEDAEPEDNQSLFVARALLFGMEREFVKRDPQTQELLEMGKKSMKVTGYIFDDEIPKPCRYFCGRSEELSEYHDLLSKEGKVFVTGMAGIGKSEFIKAYARKHKNDYTNILYLAYRGDLKKMVADLDFVDDEAFEPSDHRFFRHDRFLRKLGEDTLIIIDNFNKTAEEDPFLSEILKYRCSIVFTTRCRFEDYPEYELKEMQNMEDMLFFFSEFYPGAENQKTIEGIIEQLHRHTFAVELAARLLRLGGISPRKLLKKLEKERIKFSSKDKIRANKDGTASRDTYYGHIHTLFGLFKLKEDAKCVLRCLSLVPSDGISKRLFSFWMDMDDINRIQTLIEIGFIHEIDDTTIGLYPMIQEVVEADLEPSLTNCGGFLSNIMKDSFFKAGDDCPGYKTVMRVLEGVLDRARIDDMDIYVTFIASAFPFVTSYRNYDMMDRIITEMEKHCAESTMYGELFRIKICEFKADRALYAKDIKTSIEQMEQAIDLAEKWADCEPSFLATLYMKFGSYLDADEKKDEAAEYMMKGYAIMSEESFRPSQSHISLLCNMALLADEHGDFDNAIAALADAEKTYRESGMTRTRAYADLNSTMGQIYLRHGEDEKAKEHYQIAENIQEELWEDMPEVAGAMKAKALNGILDARGWE